MIILGILFFALLLLGFGATRIAHYKLEFSDDIESQRRYLVWRYISAVVFVICAAIFVAILVEAVFWHYDILWRYKA